MNGEFAQSEANSPSPTSAAEMTGMDIGSPFSATPLDVHRRDSTHGFPGGKAERRRAGVGWWIRRLVAFAMTLFRVKNVPREFASHGTFVSATYSWQ